MHLWTAFTLGLVGSLHCAGMCGPLALAVPVMGRSRRAIILSRLTYNSGRILTYAILGLVFGTMGQGIARAGIQQGVSIAVGVLLLLGLLGVTRGQPSALLGRWIGGLRHRFARNLRQR